jgi:hypothetical protein
MPSVQLGVSDGRRPLLERPLEPASPGSVFRLERRGLNDMKEVSVQTDMGRKRGHRQVQPLAIARRPACCAWLATQLFAVSDNTNLPGKKGVSL